jgi:16S rRNA (cytosine1402-N4)-methyltransferase
MKEGHQPVLLKEVVGAFADVQLTTFFEGTVGAGGHADALLEAHPEIVRYIACDRDSQALAIAKRQLSRWGEKVEWVCGCYGDLKEILQEREIGSINGFLIDIGVSSMQIDNPERGFSFQSEGPLDMRMDQSRGISAADVVNQFPEERLADIFYELGEERGSRKAAKAIVEARKRRRFETTQDLAGVLCKVLRGAPGRHPGTKVFQALRIFVNDELGELKRGLAAAIELLAPQGRLAVITFHSLEDRIVKWALREEKGRLAILTKKPIGPGREEIRSNPRARSAKLRVAEKR